MARRYTSKIAGKDTPKKRRYTSRVVKYAKGGLTKDEKASLKETKKANQAEVKAAKSSGASKQDIQALKAENKSELQSLKQDYKSSVGSTVTPPPPAMEPSVPTMAAAGVGAPEMGPVFDPIGPRGGLQVAPPPPAISPPPPAMAAPGVGAPEMGPVLDPIGPRGGLQELTLSNASQFTPEQLAELAVATGPITPTAAAPTPAPASLWQDLGMPEGATKKDIRKAEKQDRAELRSAQSSEIKMLESVLKEQGFTPQEIKRMVNAERKENTAERKEFVSAQKEPGLQLWAQQFTRPATAQELTRHPDAVARNLTATDIQAAIDSGALTPPQIRAGNNFSSVTSADINPEVIDTVLNRMEQGAQFLRDTKMPQLFKKTSGDATISTGLGLEQAYALSQAAADGTVTPDELVGDFFKQGGAERWTKRYDAIAPFMGDQPVAASEMADLKLKPVKNQENIFTAKLQGGGDNRMTGVFEYNPETNTYTNKSVIPTKVQVDDGGFLSSPLGALALGALSYFAAPAVAGMLGGSKVAAGAVLGGLRSALTGGDILKGALTGGVVPGVANYVGGLDAVKGLASINPALPQTISNIAGSTLGTGIMTDFDPTAMLGAGAGAGVGSFIGGQPNLSSVPGVQQGLANAAGSFTNALIQSGGDVNAALTSGAIGGAQGFLPTQISNQLQNVGVGQQTSTALGSGLTNYLIGSALGDPNAVARGVLSGAQTYAAPYMSDAQRWLYNTVLNQQPQQTQQQQPAYMTYNPFSQPR